MTPSGKRPWQAACCLLCLSACNPYERYTGEVNAGPVLKVQPNLRYATDGRTAAAFALACAQAGVPMQRYEHRADLPCGSTIGPMTAARTGIPTVDVGAAQLAMHSAREVMGADDVAAYSAALQAFLSPA